MVTGEFSFYQVKIRVDLLSHLIRAKLVVSLELGSVEISNCGLVALFDAVMSSTIRSLGLSGIELAIDEMVMNALATLMERSTSIVKYSLWGLSFPDNGVALICDALADNNVIEDLILSENSIGVEGTRIIGRFLKADKNKALSGLFLWGNRFGDEGVVALVEGLKTNTSIRTLNLMRCDVSDEGAIALASLLANGSHLEVLCLQGNQIGEAGMKALANALKHNQSLQVLGIWDVPGLDEEGVEDAFIEGLQNNVTLIELDGIELSEIERLLLRNTEEIPAAVRRAALLLIGIRRSTDIEGMGDFAVFPKDIVRLIAQTVWATRRDPIWIRALK